LLEFDAAADALEEACLATEKERDDVQLELVDQPRRQVLIDHVGAAAADDVLPGRRLARLVEGRVDPAVTKVNVVSASVSGSRG
jgi:hypothetical protein